MRLATDMNGVIINADSIQMYSSFPILSAQPDDAARSAIPHLLYGTVNAPAVSTTASWRSHAITMIKHVITTGQTPIVVGGTGLYLETLMHGISEIPDVPEDIRQKAIHDYETMGSHAFHNRLMTVDKGTAMRLPSTDSQRLIRAWAVYMATGKPLSAWQKEGLMPPPGDWEFKSILLLPDRDLLYETIDRRFSAMMEHGALDEVRHTPPLDHPSQKALGVQELRAFIRGEISQTEAIAQARQSSRNYAKRQLTWFNNRFMKREESVGRSVRVVDGRGLRAKLNV